MIRHMIYCQSGATDRWLSMMAILISVIAILAIAADRLQLFAPRAYTDVVLRAIEPVEQGYHITIAYTKTRANCTFEKAVVFGSYLGDSRALGWIPFRGPNVSEQRTPGRQLMDITVLTDGLPYDTIEVRTRHDCDGVRSDQTMAIIEVPE